MQLIKNPPRFRPSRRGWVVLALVALLLSSYLADSAAAIGRVRSGVQVDSLLLGGKNEEETRHLLADRAQLLLSAPAELFAATRRVTVSPTEVNFKPDVESTIKAAMGVGREGNFFVRLWQRLRALFASTDVGWASDFDRDATKLLVDSWADSIDTQGHEAGIELRGDTIVPISAVPGRKVDRKAAVGIVIDALETWPRRSLELPIAVETRRTDIDDARRAAEEANRWARAPIRVVVPDGSTTTLSRQQIESMLIAVPSKSGGDWSLAVRFDPDRVVDQLGEEMKQFEHEPRDASFEVTGASVSVQEGLDGRRFDPKGTAIQLAEAARRDEPRSAQAVFKAAKPDLTTKDAKALNITELVSSFTTHHPCCAERVKNIHRIADTVDGAIVRPGDQFSLNDYVGERTVEKGYVLAPMIYDGEFKDSIGGGVSQFATTMFNAIFFGGYRINTHKAHTYYISRYPPGREATVSYPNPDLRFTNDSGAGILIKTSYDESSVTVTFYGDKEGKTVTAETGPRTNPTDFEQKYVENPAIPPGQQHVLQEGAPGFDITVTRVISVGGHESRERFFTRYRAEPRIIEVAPGMAPCVTPPPGTSPTPCPSTTPPPASPAASQPPATPAPTPKPTPKN